jgi:hypothetical protein
MKWQRATFIHDIHGYGDSNSMELISGKQFLYMELRFSISVFIYPDNRSGEPPVLEFIAPPGPLTEAHSLHMLGTVHFYITIVQLLRVQYLLVMFQTPSVTFTLQLNINYRFYHFNP